MDFSAVTNGIMELTEVWEPKLMFLPSQIIIERKNDQNRSIKQILGHMIDSASNNIHRIIHLQYQESPLQFPNYASEGNNDRWIAIQNYQDEDWSTIVQLWKYLHLHLIHVINNVDEAKLDNLWDSGTSGIVSLKDMIIDFLRHFTLHLKEIEDLINH